MLADAENADKGKILLACALLAMLNGCSTPCDGPGRLCAPVTSITSTLTSTPLAQQERHAAAPVPAAPSASEAAQTFAVADPDIALEKSAGQGAVASPGTGAASPVRIALILPLRSPTLGQAASAVRDGFMAAWQRDASGFIVNLIDSGGAGPDLPADAVNTYALAVAQNDIVVGPLERSSVSAVASSGLVSKPTLALNHPDGAGALPPQMLLIGLSVEDEARQVARWANAEQPEAMALILSSHQAWQRRTVNAFTEQWQRMGGLTHSLELNENFSNSDLLQLRQQLKTQLEQQAPAILFAALDAGQLRQLDILGGALAVYGTSSLNSGNASMAQNASAESSSAPPKPNLDGVRLLDLPWQVQRDHPAVMVYPHLLASDIRSHNADLERLYALGIDAFRIAREIALHPASAFQIDGVTGRLSVSFGQGPAHFERVEQSAVYRNGVLVPLAGK